MPLIQAGVSRDVPVYFPSFCQVLIPVCHRVWAQAEYAWVPDSVPRWFTRLKINHLGTNRA